MVMIMTMTMMVINNDEGIENACDYPGELSSGLGGGRNLKITMESSALKLELTILS